MKSGLSKQEQNQEDKLWTSEGQVRENVTLVKSGDGDEKKTDP